MYILSFSNMSEYIYICFVLKHWVQDPPGIRAQTSPRLPDPALCIADPALFLELFFAMTSRCVYFQNLLRNSSNAGSCLGHIPTAFQLRPRDGARQETFVDAHPNYPS